MDNKKRDRILELLKIIFIEPVREIVSNGYNFISDHQHISFDNLFKEYELKNFFKYSLEYKPIVGLSNDLTPEENGEIFKKNVINALNELKSLGITDIIIEKDDDNSETYEGKDCVTLIKLKGSELLAGFSYIYYSYGDTEFDEEVTYIEPYEVIVTKYRAIK